MRLLRLGVFICLGDLSERLGSFNECSSNAKLGSEAICVSGTILAVGA